MRVLPSACHLRVMSLSGGRKEKRMKQPQRCANMGFAWACFRCCTASICLYSVDPVRQRRSRAPIALSRLALVHGFHSFAILPGESPAIRKLPSRRPSKAGQGSGKWGEIRALPRKCASCPKGLRSGHKNRDAAPRALPSGVPLQPMVFGPPSLRPSKADLKRAQLQLKPRPMCAAIHAESC